MSCPPFHMRGAVSVPNTASISRKITIAHSSGEENVTQVDAVRSSFRCLLG